MALSIYKRGQGYWVRMMTAVFIGTLFLACAAWLWNEGSTFAGLLPKSATPIVLEDMVGEQPTVGEIVRFFNQEENNALIEVGSGTVKGYDDLGKMLVENLSADADLSKLVRVEGPGDFAASPIVTASKPVVDTIYISGVLAAITILVGAFVVGYYVYMNKKSSEFLIATDIEMRRVNWSTRKDVIRSTMVVIVASFAIAASLFFVDVFFEWIFSVMKIRRM